MAQLFLLLNFIPPGNENLETSYFFNHSKFYFTNNLSLLAQCCIPSLHFATLNYVVKIKLLVLHLCEKVLNNY